MSKQEEDQGVTAVAVIGGLTVLGVGIYFIAKKIKEDAGGNGGGGDTATLTGKIKNSFTNQGILGAKVTVGARITYTNNQGNYSISDLDPGTYDVTVSATNYDQRLLSKEIVAGANTLDIGLIARVTLQGIVTDSVTNGAIANALVTIGSNQLYTNGSGGYSIVLPEGNYSVSASKTGYVPQTQQIQVILPLAILSFSLVQEFSNTGVIQGTVKDSSNSNGISGAVLTFTGPDAIPHQVTSGAGGGYSIELPSNSIPGITYSISGVKSGYQNYSGSVTLRTGTYTPKDILMTPVTVYYGAAHGYALDKNTGFGIYNARVVLIQNAAERYTSYTDAEGFYDIENVATGTYEIWCIANGYTQQQASIMINANQVTNYNFQMPPVGTAIGFHMEVEFDPSNYPTAYKWYCEVAGMVAAYLPVDVSNPSSIWHGPWDLTTRPWPSNLTLELYSQNGTLLYRRTSSVTMQNGHAYSIYADLYMVNPLVDLGPF
ncbi:MAG: carboxypeptidase-like regulatory domain-containing protein [Dehalococcoidales bacterium]|nr:carboxypeptidase-like regulatory domain-containing protein [Dehalococcoidales bacterium]